MAKETEIKHRRKTGQAPSDEELEQLSDKAKVGEEQGDGKSIEQWFKDFDKSIDKNVRELMQDVETSSAASKKEELKAQIAAEYNQQNMRQMVGLLPASAFPEQQKTKKSGQQEMEDSIREVRSTLGMTYLKKGGNPIYLKTMKALRGVYKNREWSTDRLDAIIFREEYVLPTINSLIESNKKAGANQIIVSQVQDAFGELAQERKKTVSIGSVFTKNPTAVEINGKINTRNQLLQSFAKVSEGQGDTKLAASCKWAVRSFSERIEKLGKSIRGAKPGQRDEDRSSKVKSDKGMQI
jgi:hypothetical protein